MEELSIGLQDASAVLGLSIWTLRSWIRKGRLKAVKLGRRTVVEPSELRRLVEQGRNQGKENDTDV